MRRRATCSTGTCSGWYWMRRIPCSTGARRLPTCAGAGEGEAATMLGTLAGRCRHHAGQVGGQCMPRHAGADAGEADTSVDAVFVHMCTGVLGSCGSGCQTEAMLCTVSGMRSCAGAGAAALVPVSCWTIAGDYRPCVERATLIFCEQDISLCGVLSCRWPGGQHCSPVQHPLGTGSMA